MAQVDVGIYGNLLRPVKSVQEYDAEAQQAEGNKLSLLLQRGQYDAQQRGVADDNAFRNALSAPDANIGDAAFQRRLMSISPTKAQAVIKGNTDQQAAQAKLTKDQYDAIQQKFQIAGQIMGGVTDQASWDRARQQTAQVFGPEAAAQMPAQYDPRLIEEKRLQALDAKAQFEQHWKGIESGQRDRDLTERERNNKVQNGIAAGQLRVSQGQLGVAQQRLATEQSAPKGQYDAERGLLIDPRTGDAKPVTMGGKPIAPKAKSGPMSVTLQKELIESDDNVQQSASAIAALKKAKAINDKAYSGYGASTRAALVSNLGGSKSADATVELDNLIGNQALSSLKTIFGGNPTEGERAILLDLQASSSKTPAQRTAIIDRAIKAAEVRAKYAGSKAQSIRSGKYLTEGAPSMRADDDIHSQADAILRGGK